MKVLFVTRPDLGMLGGGMMLQVAKTRAALARDGVDVCGYDPWVDSLHHIDVCHLFTMDASLYHFAIAARSRGIAVVVSPVANSGSSLVVTAAKARALSRLPGVYVEMRLQRRILATANRIICLSIEESMFLQRAFGADPARMSIVPNGVERRFADASPELFVRRFGFSPDVLFVGRIHRGKNLRGLIAALRGTGLRLAVIGAPAPDEQEYDARCRAEAGHDVEFLGALDHSDPLLPSAYAAARVFALPSFKEVMPLTVLEALGAGCRVVVTRHSALRSLVREGATYVDPSSKQDVRDGIVRALERPPPVALRRSILAEYSWESVASKVQAVYRQVALERRDRAADGATVDMVRHSGGGA